MKRKEPSKTKIHKGKRFYFHSHWGYHSWIYTRRKENRQILVDEKTGRVICDTDEETKFLLRKDDE